MVLQVKVELGKAHDETAVCNADLKSCLLRSGPELLWSFERWGMMSKLYWS